MFKDSRIKYYIFGAHSRGQTMGMYLKTLYAEWTFLGYLYDNDEDNSEEIDGDRVFSLPDSLGSVAEIELESEATVYIATRGVYHEQIKSKLEKYGFKKIIPVTPELDMELRNRYLKDFFSENNSIPCLRSI